MQIQDDIKTLHNYEAFARFIKMIHELREETIEELFFTDLICRSFLKRPCLLSTPEGDDRPIFLRGDMGAVSSDMVVVL